MRPKILGGGDLGGRKKSTFGSFSISIPANAFVFELTFDELAEDESALDEDACLLPPPQLKTK